jgi:hypothetical protein
VAGSDTVGSGAFDPRRDLLVRGESVVDVSLVLVVDISVLLVS